MQTLINRQLLTQTSLDSGSLTMLGSVFHRFSEAGKYHGVVLQGTKSVTTFSLTVMEEYEAMQTEIDLATIEQQRRHFTLKKDGYAVFYVSRGSGGYAVVVTKLEKSDGVRVFDSRKLQQGDLFTATLIRPGKYTLRDANNDGPGEIVVAYPRPTGRRYVQPEPIYIDCTEQGFDPNRISVAAAQGQIYRCRTSSRIMIDLEEPDDGPNPNRSGSVVRWQKLSTG